MLTTNVIVSLAERAAVGRILLSLLPPGLPGRHTPRDLPSTWAASHLLGTAALLLESEIFGLRSLSPSHPFLLAPWALVALVRWLTLPGALVPRHEPLSEPSGPLAGFLLFLSALAIPATAFLRPAPIGLEGVLRLADALALLALAAFGLASARRAPLGRGIAILCLSAILSAAIATSAEAAVAPALFLGGGAALGVPWLRRGDRRAAAFAAIAAASTALLGPRAAFLGAAGLLALCLHTPAPSGPGLAMFSAASLIACALPSFLHGEVEPPAEPAATPATLVMLVVVAWALWTRRRILAARAGEAAPTPEGRIDPSRPQSALMRDTLLLAVVVLAARGDLARIDLLFPTLLPLAPLLAIELCLLLAPAERPLGDSRAPEAAPVPVRR